MISIREVNESWANLIAEATGFKPARARFDNGVLTMRFPGGDDYSEEVAKVETIAKAKQLFMSRVIETVKACDAYEF